MRLVKYATKYNQDRIIGLVKEAAINYENSTIVNSAIHAVEIIQTLFDAGNLPQENLWLLTLDRSRKCNGAFCVSTGTLFSSLVHPREIFQRAVLAGAASIIIIHNHPSGSLQVSAYDKEVTQRIRQAGELMGIPLDDHIIIAGSGWISAA